MHSRWLSVASLLYSCFFADAYAFTPALFFRNQSDASLLRIEMGATSEMRPTITIGAHGKSAEFASVSVEWPGRWSLLRLQNGDEIMVDLTARDHGRGHARYYHHPYTFESGSSEWMKLKYLPDATTADLAELGLMSPASAGRARFLAIDPERRVQSTEGLSIWNAYEDIFGNLLVEFAPDAAARIGLNRFVWGTKDGPVLKQMSQDLRSRSFEATSADDPDRKFTIDFGNSSATIRCPDRADCLHFARLDAFRTAELEKKIRSGAVQVERLPDTRVRGSLYRFGKAPYEYLYLDESRFRRSLDQPRIVIGRAGRMTRFEVSFSCSASHDGGTNGDVEYRLYSGRKVQLPGDGRYGGVPVRPRIKERDGRIVPLEKIEATDAILTTLGFDLKRFDLPTLETPCDLLMTK